MQAAETMAQQRLALASGAMLPPLGLQMVPPPGMMLALPPGALPSGALPLPGAEGFVAPAAAPGLVACAAVPPPALVTPLPADAPTRAVCDRVVGLYGHVCAALELLRSRATDDELRAKIEAQLADAGGALTNAQTLTNALAPTSAAAPHVAPPPPLGVAIPFGPVALPVPGAILPPSNGGLPAYGGATVPINVLAPAIHPSAPGVPAVAPANPLSVAPTETPALLTLPPATAEPLR